MLRQVFMTLAAASSVRKHGGNGSTALGVGVICAALLAFGARYHFARTAEDHGVAQAIRGVEDRLRPEHARWAAEIELASKKQSACGGVRLAATRGLDADQGSSVIELIDRARKACPNLNTPGGMLAEARARSGQGEAAASATREALQLDPRDAYALYADALLGWRAARPDALERAERAVSAGRGASALLLQGLIAYAANRLDVAESAFQRSLRDDPEDVDALYNLALVRQRQNRYLEAREGYLKVLRLRPAHAGARFNLGVFAHSIGAKEEAQHHLAKLRASAPNSPLVAQLEALLARPVEPARGAASSPHYSLQLGAAPPARNAAPNAAPAANAAPAPSAAP